MKLSELNDKVGKPINANMAQKKVYEKLFGNLKEQLDELEADKKTDGIIPKTKQIPDLENFQIEFKKFLEVVSELKPLKEYVDLLESKTCI